MLSYDFNEIIDDIQNPILQPLKNDIIQKVESCNDYIDFEIEKLDGEIVDDEVPDELAINYTLLYEFKERNLRVLKMYKYHRLLKIEEAILNNQEINSQFLNTKELNYKIEFGQIIDDYYRNYDYLELNICFFNNFTDNGIPDEGRICYIPIDYFIKIMVVGESCGVIMSGDEFINLIKDHVYFLKKKDIIHLINNKQVVVLD